MPHIIIEYSRTLGEIIEIPRLVKKVHNTMAAQGVGKDRIKTRAYACNYSAVGEIELRGHMLHATIVLLKGRDAQTKKRYGDAIYKDLKDSVEGVVRACSVSLEIREMDADMYFH